VLIASLARLARRGLLRFFRKWSQTTCDTPRPLWALTTFGEIDRRLRHLWGAAPPKHHSFFKAWKKGRPTYVHLN
jgi:hypothetical protein